MSNKFKKGDLVTSKNERYPGDFRVLRYIEPQPFSTPAVEVEFINKKDSVVLPETDLELKSEQAKTQKAKNT